MKLGQHRSSETTLEVGVPQGYVLGSLLFAVYCSPVADVIASHGVRCHQYANDTQLHLAMRVDNTAASLSILTACTTNVKQWYMQNKLQLNPDKSEALFMGTATQLRAVSSLKSEGRGRVASEVLWQISCLATGPSPQKLKQNVENNFKYFCSFAC